MAIARLSVGTGSKGKAGPHAQYIAREGKYAKPDDNLEKLEFTGSGNMPRWAEHEPNYFWRMADEHERKNGSTYREHVIALPRELTADQRHELLLDWIAKEIGDKHAYQYAIHNPPSLDGGEQPHAHIMFSERTRDSIERDPEQYFKRYNPKNPEKGGAKKANTGMKPADRRADLLAQRERWEQTCNKHLERAGSEARISMKSLAAQGIEREPVNIPMRQFKIPSVLNTYKEWLRAKAEHLKALEEQKRIDVTAELESLAEQSQTAQYEWIDDAVARINDGENMSHYLAMPLLARHQDSHIMGIHDDPNDPDNAHKFNEQQLEKINDWAKDNDLNRLDSEDVRGHMRRVYEFFASADNVAKNQDIIDLMHNPQEHREPPEQAQNPTLRALQEQKSIDVTAELESLAEQSQTAQYEWIDDAVARINDGENMSHYLAMPLLARHQDSHIMGIHDDPNDPDNAHKFNEQQLEKINQWAEYNGLNRLANEDVRGHMRRVYEFFASADNVAKNQDIIDLMHNPQAHREPPEQAQNPTLTDKALTVEQAQPRTTRAPRPR